MIGALPIPVWLALQRNISGAGGSSGSSTVDTIFDAILIIIGLILAIAGLIITIKCFIETLEYKDLFLMGLLIFVAVVCILCIGWLICLMVG